MEPPAYITFGAEASVSGSISYKPQTCNSSKALAIKTEPAFSIFAGIGIGTKKILSCYVEAGLAGKLRVPINYSTVSADNMVEIYLKCQLYGKGSLFGIINASKTIDLGEDMCLYSSAGKKKAETLAGAKSGGEDQENTVLSFSKEDFKAAPRTAKIGEEAEEDAGEKLAGSLLPGETFTEINVFAEANPRMVTFANGDRLAVWQDEVPSKADDDRTSLFYRYYDSVAGSWGETSVLFENGAFNGAPALATDGEKAYLVWQRASRTLGTSGDIDGLIVCLDLWCAEFADGTFGEPVCVSAEGNGLAKSLYDVSARNGMVSVIWTENSENDLFDSSGTNTLYLRSFVNGNWQQTVTVAGTTDVFMDADVSLENGSPRVVYRTAQDGSASAISVFENGSNTVIESEGNLANLEMSGTELYYLKDGALYIFDGADSTATNLTGIDNFSLLQNSGRTAVVTIRKDGDTEEFWRSDLDVEEGTFGAFYRITDFGKHIRSYQAELDDAGSVILLANQVELTGDEGDPYGRADIVLWSEEDYFDLEVGSYARYDNTSVAAGKNLALAVDVKNNGSQTVSGFTATVTDTLGTVLATVPVEGTLAAGEQKTLTVNYPLPTELQRQTVYITIASERAEADITNNTAEVEFGYADIAVENLVVKTVRGIPTLRGEIANNGYENAANVTLEVIDQTTGESPYGMVSIAETLKFGEMQMFTCPLPERYWSLFNDNMRYELLVKASCETEEADLSNNEERIVFADLHESLIPSFDVESISLSSSNASLSVGETLTLSVTFDPEDATEQELSWESDNPAIASVNGGVVTALSAGSATIIAASTNGKTASCEIHVHRYGEPTFVWEEEYASWTARFTCGEDGFVKEVPCGVSETRTEPTCIKDGNITYRASLQFEGNLYADEKVASFRKLGHVDEGPLDGICDRCGRHTYFAIALTSCIDGGSGATVALLQGGGVYEAAEDGTGPEVTVTAENKLGFDFKGWYPENGTGVYEGEPLSRKLSYSFHPEEHLSLVAVYAATSSKALLRVSGSVFTITGSSLKQKTLSRNYLLGSELTLCFAEDGREFLYWANESGKIVSTAEEYTFTMVGPTVLEAVSVSAEDYPDEAVALVEFVSLYNQVVAAQYYTASDEIEFPDAPSKSGARFVGWDHLANAIANEISSGKTHVRVKPVYESTGAEWTLTIRSEGLAEEFEETMNMVEGTASGIAAPEQEGYIFSKWVDEDGILLTTKPTYLLTINRPKTIIAVYVPEGEVPEAARPVVAMTAAAATVSSGTNKIAFVATRDVPEGYAVTETGILYGTSEEFGGENSKEIMVLNGSGVRKLSTYNAGLQGNYIGNISVGAKLDTRVYARGYLIVQDENGSSSIIYSENIYGYTFNELNV